MEPTMKEIADKILEYAELFDDLTNLETPGAGMRKLAAQVEAMGERRCLNCEWWEQDTERWEDMKHQCLHKSKDVEYSSPDFGCTHWERKEG